MKNVDPMHLKSQEGGGGELELPSLIIISKLHSLA